MIVIRLTEGTLPLEKAGGAKVSFGDQRERLVYRVVIARTLENAIELELIVDVL